MRPTSPSWTPTSTTSTAYLLRAPVLIRKQCKAAAEAIQVVHTRSWTTSWKGPGRTSCLEDVRPQLPLPTSISVATISSNPCNELLEHLTSWVAQMADPSL